MPDASPRVIVYGDVIDDVVVIPSGPVRRDTDTPSTVSSRAGGAAANVSCWLASCGVGVDFFGSVARADLARHRAAFDAARVTAHLTGHPTLPTGAIVVLVEGESRTMLTQRGANSALDPRAVTDALLDSAAHLHLSGYSVMDCRDRPSLRELVERARRRGVQVSVDPASAGGIVDFGAARMLDEMRGCSIVFPNLDEGRALTGLDDPEGIVVQLGLLFPVVALTNGPAGAIVAQNGGAPVHVPAVDVTIVDPTGAGDAFAAGFLHVWVGEQDAVAAARAGVALAARAVQSIGARPRT